MKFLFVWILYFLAGGSVFAQTTTKDEASANPQSQVTADVLKKLDQLFQQNEQLETQNHELVAEIKSLRQLLAQQSSVSPTSSKGGSTASANSPAPANSANKPAAQQSGQAWPAQGNNDDKTLLPQASQGNDAIFGEFNPGRGFTVGRGEYGELNLSGYMAVRYLNQMPADQSATDHLGRPVPIDPRQDFQFHRVMLFSQGWMFSPKFQYSTFLWTVQDTNQVAVGGALYYDFGKFMNLGAGWNAYPGTLSLQGSHPYQHAAMLESILSDPGMHNVYFDISWDEVAKYIVASPESVRITADLINRYPERFLFGTDEVAPSNQEKYLRVYRQYEPLWNALSPQASEDVRKGNYERLFDEARRKVRTWEAANSKGDRATPFADGPASELP